MRHPEPGDDAPRFTLPGTARDGAAPEEYRLADAVEDGPAILNFYLFDFHPACTDHLCSFDRLSWFTLADGVTTFGISTDSVYSSAEFAETAGIDFPLLADSDGSVAERYAGLHDEMQGHKRVSRRAVYVVDSDATVQYAWRAEQPADQPDWEELKATVDEHTDSPDVGVAF